MFLWIKDLRFFPTSLTRADYSRLVKIIITNSGCLFLLNVNFCQIIYYNLRFSLYIIFSKIR